MGVRCELSYDHQVCTLPSLLWKRRNAVRKKRCSIPVRVRQYRTAQCRDLRLNRQAPNNRKPESVSACPELRRTCEVTGRAIAQTLHIASKGD